MQYLALYIVLVSEKKLQAQSAGNFYPSADPVSKNIGMNLFFRGQVDQSQKIPMTLDFGSENGKFNLFVK